MTIAFDAKRAFHNSRGLGNYSRDYVRLAARYAPNNHYLLFNPRRRQDLFDATADCLTEVLPKGLWQLAPGMWRSFGCTDLLSQLNADIYHGLSAELPLNIHKTSVKKVVTIHDAIFLRYPELYSPTYRRLLTRKVRYACEVADVVVAISQQTRSDCIELLGADEKKLRVMYQGCNSAFRLPITQEQKDAVRQKYNLPATYLLYVGAIEPRKNLSNLLLALSTSGLDIPLVVVGAESRYAEQMKRLAADKHLSVRFLHRTDFSDLPAIYSSAYALTYPSLFEGFGIPILEAMCSSLPVLTSTGSCFSETAGEAALYADPTDIDDLADKLQTIVSDNSVRQRLIANTALQADKFSDENIGRKIKALYESLC